MRKTKLLVISASQRIPSASQDLAQYVCKNKLTSLQDIEYKVLDIAQYPILLDHYFPPNENEELLREKKQEVLSLLYWCDCVVFVVPEWGGMIPPALVNLFLLTANGSAGGLPLGHKPGFAIGISASGGGSNPISLLKAYAAKNSHLSWLSLHAIVNNVDEFVKTPWAPNQPERFNQVQSRINIGIDSLVIYSEQLKPVRDKLVELTQIHPFGQ